VKDDFDNNRIGLWRVEMFAESKEDVDEFYKHLREFEIDIIRAPEFMFTSRPDHINYEKGEKWYATYFRDINGIIFGYVYSDWRL